MADNTFLRLFYMSFVAGVYLMMPQSTGCIKYSCLQFYNKSVEWKANLQPSKLFTGMLFSTEVIDSAKLQRKCGMFSCYNSCL